jgi:hypothetical protein
LAWITRVILFRAPGASEVCETRRVTNEGVDLEHCGIALGHIRLLLDAQGEEARDC